MSDAKPNVAFICVHNSCRSQIAEALGRHLASESFISFSAGTQTKPQINRDAVRLMKRYYGIDMDKDQHSKLIEALPAVDIVITMGCEVDCPALPARFRFDWGLLDPSGKGDEAMEETIRLIHEKILELEAFLKNPDQE